jgi:hypothetical protein
MTGPPTTTAKRSDASTRSRAIKVPSNAPSCNEPFAKGIFIKLEDTIRKLLTEGSPTGLDGAQ